MLSEVGPQLVEGNGVLTLDLAVDGGTGGHDFDRNSLVKGDVAGEVDPKRLHRGSVWAENLLDQAAWVHLVDHAGEHEAGFTECVAHVTDLEVEFLVALLDDGKGSGCGAATAG